MSRDVQLRGSASRPRQTDELAGEGIGLQHMAGLDGLRGVAILLVVLVHQQILQAGWIGVQIFFVLSGFLISRSLIQLSDLPLGHYLKVFYLRRTLRIFPVYYAFLAVLGILAAFHVMPPRVFKELPIAATYTFNLYHSSRAFLHSQSMSHLWSLSVEEQIYMVWPFLVYFCPARHRLFMFGTLAFAGPLIRLLTRMAMLAAPSLFYADHYLALYVLTPSHVDAFAMGALLVLRPIGGKPRWILLSLGLTVLLGQWVLTCDPHLPYSLVPVERSSFGYPLGVAPGYGYLWAYSLLNITSGLVMDGIVHRKFFPAFFEWRPLCFLGRVSYGFYLFHYPVQDLLERYFRLEKPVELALQLVITLGLSTVSFFMFESKLLALKNRVAAR